MVKTTSQLLNDFFCAYTKRKYKKGEMLVRAGDIPLGALFLTSGLVRMSFSTDSGDMLVLHVFKKGSIFPLPWIINDESNRYFFEAITPVEVWRAPREDVLRLMSEEPSIGRELLSRVLLGLSGLLRRMEFLVFDSAYKKTVYLLAYYAKHFRDDAKGGELLIPLTHREIAAWIGTTRETASLQIESLKRKKILSYNKRIIIIPDVSALHKEADISDALL